MGCCVPTKDWLRAPRIAVLPTVTEIAKKLHLEVFLFRAYSNPYSPFVSGRGHYAANLDELMAIVRDEARNYLEEKMAELGK
jgi:hypothetical protein